MRLIANELSPLKVLALIGEQNASSMWRVWQPCQRLQEQNYPAVWGWLDDPGLHLTAQGADIIVLPRLGWTLDKHAARDRWFDALRRAGKCLIYEVDDDHFSGFFARHLVESEWKTMEQAEQASANVREALQMCDGVTVSVQRLATLVRTLTDKPVVVAPNAIDLRWWDAVLARALRVPEARGYTTIGWSGARRPSADFDAMLTAWSYIAKRHPEVRFVVNGYKPKSLYQYVPESQVVSLPWLAPEEYPLGFKSIDIGCCVLKDEPFNRCKSDIKAQEYGASGIAVVYSPTVYGVTLRDGKDGLMADSADDWTEQLTRLLEDERLRKRLAHTLHKRVRKEMCLDVNLWRWPYAWESIYQDFSARRARDSLVIARA